MNLTPEEVNKMKVVELRAELQVRGLDPKGVKAVLVDRLLAALGHEGGAVASVGNGSAAASLDLSSGDADESKGDEEADSSQVEAVDEADPPDTSNVEEEDQKMEESLPSQPIIVEPKAKVEEAIEEDVDDNENGNGEGEGEREEEEKDEDVPMAEVKDESEEKEEDKNKDAVVPPAETEGGSETVDDAAVKMETDQEGDNVKRKIEAVNGDTTEENKIKKPRTEETIVFKNVPLNEPDIDENAVVLDWYKSDLNLKISTENFLEAEPTVYEDFPFAYAGVKATYGFTKGKLGFEAKWIKSCEVRSDFGDKETKHVFRVGWSDVNADLQLGEDKLSIGYDVSGKVYNGGEIQDLGGALVEGDVVTAYLDLESDPVEVKFAKNGEIIGEPVKIEKADLEGKSLYPHVLVRNVKFEVNFGSKDPAHEVLEGFQMVGKVEDTDRIRGPTRPEKKDDCELIMLVGLACSGKTKWAKDFIKNNPEKHYNILGTSTAVERALKDQSILSSQKAPRVFDSFFMKAGKFVERLVDIAPSRKRNYILDQSNVLPSVQRRKCGGFENFRRRAVVILPPDEEYQKRIKSKEQEQGKSVPKSTILDMKASFRLPDVGELFAEVEFPELQREQAQELVTKYNKEGVTAGYGRPQSGRGGPRGGLRGRGNMRGRGGPRGGPGGRPWRGGPPPHRGGPMGGYGMRRGGPPGPPPMRIPRGPPVNMGGPPRGGGRGMPPMRGGMRGSGGPPPQQRGGLQPRGGSWARGGNNMNSNRGPPPQRGRGGGGRGGPPMQSGGSGRWGSGMGGPQRPNPGGRAPQGGNFQSWGQGNWGGGRGGGAGNTGFGGGYGADPWVHQQVPDQGFGQSWDSVGGSGNRGGTWQGYGGQTLGNAGRR